MKRNSLIISLLLLPIVLCSGGEIRRYCFDEWCKEIGYSQAVAVDNTLYLSGIVGEGETMEEALTLAVERIDCMLKRFNLDRSCILKEKIYTNDIENLRSATYIRKKYYAPYFPAAVWIKTEKKDTSKKWLEVELIVHIPNGHELPEEE